MAYLVAAASTERIDCGAVTTAATWSAYLRLKMTGNPATIRRLMLIASADALSAVTLFWQTEFTNNDLKLGFTDGGGANYREVVWSNALTPGTIYRLVGTYDGANLKLYADTDATAKATAAATTTPDTTGVTLAIGNYPGAAFGSVSADATIYEAAWWPGTVLTGAQAAALGGGNAAGIPLPADYWPLVTDANALYGGHHGTVTGATVVAHSGSNLYPLVAPALVFRPLQA